jgi:hypothetical protein
MNLECDGRLLWYISIIHSLQTIYIF